MYEALFNRRQHRHC